MALSPLASESAFVRGSVQKADGSELIGALVPLLRSTLRRRGLAAADVDDALQATCVALHRRRAHLAGLSASELAAYARRVALGAAVDLHRASPRVEAAGEVADEEDVAAASSLSPLRVFESRDTLRRVHDVLAALHPRDRDTWTLVAIEGLSAPEVSARIGVPIGTVASRLRRVRELLRTAENPKRPALAT